VTAHEYDEIRDELRAVARDLLSKNPRASISTIAKAGWLGLEAPEDAGGAAASFREVAVIVEEMGRAAARNNYFGTGVLGVATLTSLRPGTVRDVLLKDMVSGAVTTAVALSGDHGSIGGRAPFTLEEAAGGLRLRGESVFVPDASGVERLLLLADDPAGVPVIVEIDVDAAGLSVIPQPVLDDTRRLAAINAEDVALERSSVLRFEGDTTVEVHRLFDRACVAVAADSLGLAEAMLAATVSYAKVRHQFDRAIGSFQAVKHACAGMLVQTSVARQLVTAAVEAVAGGDADSAVAASMAKSYACAAAVDVVGKAMQLHGGIGYTWETGVHVYLKRAALNRSLFGSPASHRKQLAKRYG
jgi:alkylation response protein AidB-like acyl-CoA dehydrogenase